MSYTFPESVRMTREWPQGILPFTTATFINDAGCKFLSVQNVYIDMHCVSKRPYISIAIIV